MTLAKFRPHVLGIDDSPFDKSHDRNVHLVAVMTEGHDLVESVATAVFPVDGDDATGFLARWIGSTRFCPALQAVVLGGASLAGLAVVDLQELSERLGVPALIVNRREPSNAALLAALVTAGLADRAPIVARLPAAWQLDAGLWVAAAGADTETAAQILRATLHKSRLPEPLRLAHLIGAALANGESRGRP